MPPGLGWTVLALVFLDELLALVALGIWGADLGGWLLAVSFVAAGVLVWYLLASPKAPYGGPIVRPLAKILVFGTAVAGLALIGQVGWAVALAVFSVAVNAAALHPDITHLPSSAAGPRA